MRALEAAWIIPGRVPRLSAPDVDFGPNPAELRRFSQDVWRQPGQTAVESVGDFDLGSIDPKE
jgi:hypothetical protein